ncbi:MAG: hypothetical protein FJ102_23785 [Deltaproteobacteria bacterium]|nr:hypothetical protein [Deltaproteobacteria bacterium]
MTTLADVLRPRALQLLLALPAVALPLFVGSLAAGVAERAGWALALEVARSLDAEFDNNPTTDRLCAAVLARGDPGARARATVYPCPAR